MIKEEIRICLTGGATGGHFFPLLFVAQEIKKIAIKKQITIKIFYLGSKPFDENLLRQEGIEIYLLPEVKFRKYFSIKNFIDLIKFPINFILAFYYLFKFLPNIIFSKGGPGSLGVILSGWILRLPIIIHDSDSIPGLTNRISGLFAKKIFLAFKEAENYFPQNKVQTVGQPIDYLSFEEKISFENYSKYNLDPNKKIVLIMGGSQGSLFLNELTVQILPELLNLAQVVHLIGNKNFEDIYYYALGMLNKNNPTKINDYHPFALIPNKEVINLMRISDLIISRAGSSSIFEIAASQKPSILIPIEEKIAGKHQVKNAEIYLKYGACSLIDEMNATPHILLTMIKEILTNQFLREKMIMAAKNFAKIDAAQKIALELINNIRQ